METRRHNYGMMGRMLMAALSSIGTQHTYKLSAPPAEKIVPASNYRPETRRARLTFGGTGKTKKNNRLHISKKAKLRRRK